MLDSLRRAARPWLVLLSAAAILAAAAGGAVAGHLTGGVKEYTGCLTGGGALVDIREGTEPAKPCTKGAVEAHFSGGDITAITAGFGLTGGGTNGAVSIALDPAYALRDDCASGQVVKWSSSSGAWVCANDNDTQYSAGTGLELSGTEFSLERFQRLPEGCELGEAVGWGTTPTSLGEWVCIQYTFADESCPTGQFVLATASDGGLTCGAPSTGAAGKVYAKSVAEANAPEGFSHTVGSLSLPAGKYLVHATATAVDDGGADIYVSCSLVYGATTIGQSAAFADGPTAGADQVEARGAIAITGPVTLPATGSVSLTCTSFGGSDHVEDVWIVAQSVNDVEIQ